MNRVRPVIIQEDTFKRMVDHAERSYPYECCGVVLGIGPEEQLRPIRNIQNEKHAESPEEFPRDARTAYLMHPADFRAALEEAATRKLPLSVIYHSHPDHDAYFSPTDRAAACLFDPNEADYPDTAQIVISVKSGRFADAAAFVWDPIVKDFVRTELIRR